jgi:diacylglycerol kinase
MVAEYRTEAGRLKGAPSLRLCGRIGVRVVNSWQYRPARMSRSWSDKFRSAFRGLLLAIRRERSFAVHVPMAVLVAIAAVIVRVSLVEACVLGLCVTVVIAAEIFNTSIEFLSREITRDQRPGLADALDMASGAVLATSLGAAAIGAAIFVNRLIALFG